ncbi:reverse transcriptase domain-containing protein [Citrus sinensis]|uniref:Reverse transcriptase domain-containing protein n=1 Tax=Citrus sinensis TaxID=2711 RepID=A0ACB8L883_CITSI|nr:reverse transcriptase domain-containing protein [Citrus sinensis]
MRILSWNVRGLGSDRTFREAQEVVHEHKPQIVFFCKTKMTREQMRKRSYELYFANCFAVSREGLGGGLAMLWNSEITVEIKSFSCHHIDAVVYSEKGSYWRCTGIYGHPEAAQKQHTWKLLRRLATLSSLPWLYFGDFNEVLNLNEKLGGNEKQVNSVADFREAVRECDFIDMGFTGYPFTWSNRRFGVGLIEERLDRFLCSRSLGNYFQEKAAMNLVTWSSDHNPILMEVLEKGSGLRYSRRTFRRVHHEDMWSPYEKCGEIVKREWKESSCWDRGNPVDLFQRKSKESLAELKLWSNEEFKGRQKRLKQLKERLKEIRQNYGHYDNGLEVKNIERQIDNILIDEEIFWKQRSRADWLREEDRNTKFFHAKASARKRKNKIMGLEDEDGVWKEEAEEVERLLCDYFANIFSTTNPSQTQLETAVAELPKRVTEEMNCFLDQQFTAEEVAEALAQMCPTKAPGPDGLPAAFYQKHWSSVKEGVTTTCLHILNEGGSIAPLNHTYIALIPKLQNPRKVTNFWPISLCNVIYRIVAKTLANRLKQILDTIISPTQSAFIPNRLITDNVIIGYECLNKIRQSRGKKYGLVALKLDISKAYDRIEWNFLKTTMQQLGFSANWVNLIMNCISTASFSVLINGEAKGLIYPQRGLRQGCPLSPYLFIICAEVFSNLLMQAEKQKLIQGLKFSRNLSISHLLFADDSLVFSRASSVDCRHLKKIFEVYAAASGQIFNFEKSSIFFSTNTKQSQMDEIGSIFNLNVVSRHERYLGLPSMVGRKKTNFFNYVKLRVLNKLTSWESKFFSCGGKEVLIKVVAQAVPAYAMSVFKIPQSICDDIQKAVAKFWWSSAGNHRGIHWAKWGRLCQAKIRGGLGFRDFSCFNQALIAKQGWRLIQNPEALMARVLKAKYFKNSSFMDAKLGANPSFVWRSILWGRQTIHKGSRWRIGNGEQVPENLKPLSIQTLHPNSVVANLISNQTWKADSGYQLSLRLKSPDLASSLDLSKTHWKIIWSMEIPEKIKIFMWRAAQNMLPTAYNLWKRKAIKEPMCGRCSKENEDGFHALIGCKYANKDMELIIATCWSIWSSRNLFIFKGKEKDAQISVGRAAAIVESYRRIKILATQTVSQNQSNNQQTWLPPPNGWYKVNVDAAIRPSNQTAGLGVVIRDSRAKVVAAAVQNTIYKGDVDCMEAEAIIFGIQVAQNTNFLPLIIESDSKEVVNLACNRKGSRTEIFWKIATIQDSLKRLSRVQIQHVSRSFNRIAPGLAKKALEYESSVVWLGNYPDEILLLLAIDS